MIDRDALVRSLTDFAQDDLPNIDTYADRILALDEPNHPEPWEVVIPCASEAEAWEERADLHVAVEARSLVRRADKPTDRERIRAELIDSLPPSPKSAIWVDGVLARAFER